MKIRYATIEDIPAINHIARQHKHALGWVRRDALTRGIAEKSLHVALGGDQGIITGFVLYHLRRDGWHIIYDLAVAAACQERGIGRALLYSVPCPMRLKCPEDLPANIFYENAGMIKVNTEAGRKRALNVYEMRVLSVLVAGKNKDFPAIARYSGMAYGVAQRDKAWGWPYMVDIDWQAVNWSAYMALVNQYHPVQAMCVDYESPDQRRSLYQQIRALKAAGVMRILVCPKFPGAINHIPAFCVIALSVPTKDKNSKYAGWLPPHHDMLKLRGRRVHLLGGAPHKQAELIQKVALFGGRVISVDFNAHQTAARRGSVWRDGRWYRNTSGEWQVTGNNKMQQLMVISGRAIHNYLQTLTLHSYLSTAAVRAKRGQSLQLQLL